MRTTARFESQKIDASFAPTDRPGVFAFEPGSSSLLTRLFADPATANPLEGETLLWARLAGATLTVYSLEIDTDGGFDLDRYARTLTDQGMTVRYDHRIENDLILTVEGRLEARGRLSMRRGLRMRSLCAALTVRAARRAGLLALFWLLPAAALGAAPDDLKPFFGSYVGVATVEEIKTGEVGQRDMDIVIQPYHEGGFRIDWINVTLVDGRRDLPASSAGSRPRCSSRSRTATSSSRSRPRTRSGNAKPRSPCAATRSAGRASMGRGCTSTPSWSSRTGPTSCRSTIAS